LVPNTLAKSIPDHIPSVVAEPESRLVLRRVLDQMPLPGLKVVGALLTGTTLVVLAKLRSAEVAAVTV
jgi:hypothetical protein